jgi:dihydrofolate reductase
MRILSAFQFMSLNGFFEGLNGDISWNMHGEEENQWSLENLESRDMLLFGRVTYEMMARFWRSELAATNWPQVASRMHEAEKLVFSRTMQDPGWYNSRVMKDHIIAEISRLKQLPGKNMMLLGSGNILTQLADAGLIDKYQIMMYPVAIGQGNTLFHNLQKNLRLQLTSSRIFKSGTVLLSYEPN